MTDVIIEPGKVDKLADLPPYTIALDGRVQGPQIDEINHRYSFDHHDGCLRFCTLSATGQAYTTVLLGLDPEPYTIRVNDVDIDVCASIWCLLHPDRCKEPLVTKLVDAVNKGDMHAGAVPLNGMAKTVDWISAPETNLKRDGGYENQPISGLYNVLEAILHRIDKYVDGEAMEEIHKFHPKHGDFKILRNENGWVLVESSDPHCYSQLYQAGYDRIVLIRRLKDSLAVSFSKRSEFIDHFNLHKIYEEINKIEPGAGGGNTKGGVVRNEDGSRSKVFFNDLDKLITIVDLATKE